MSMPSGHRGDPSAVRRTWIAAAAGQSGSHLRPRSTPELVARTAWRHPLAVAQLALVLPVWIVHDVLVYLFDRGFTPKVPRGNTLNWRHPAAFVLMPFFALAFIAAGIVFNPLTQRYIDSRRERHRRPSP